MPLKYTPCPDHGSSSKKYVRGCPGCRRRERERMVDNGRVKPGGEHTRVQRIEARAAMTPAEKLADNRAKQNAQSKKYRERWGRPHDHRYPGRKTASLQDYWRSKGVDPDVCTYCRAPAEHADHVMPRTLGGPDEFYNMLPACAPCNHSKSNKHPIVWLNELLARVA